MYICKLPFSVVYVVTYRPAPATASIMLKSIELPRNHRASDIAQLRECKPWNVYECRWLTIEAGKRIINAMHDVCVHAEPIHIHGSKINVDSAVFHGKPSGE